jgi:GMP synthase (glutamine-hydrolysing)
MKRVQDLRFLLIQARERGDDMAPHEQQCFAEALGVEVDAILTHNIIDGTPPEALIDEIDVILIGGSGDYSVTYGKPFIKDFIDFVGKVILTGDTPTFASCFGFQAMVEAGGGRVIQDRERTEVGVFTIHMTDAGREDPLLKPLAPSFPAQLGHTDLAVRLPSGMTNLAFSDRAPYQALRVDGKPIFAVQFHPELTGAANRLRFTRYCERYPPVDTDERNAVLESMVETPEASGLLRRWVEETLQTQG